MIYDNYNNYKNYKNYFYCILHAAIVVNFSSFFLLHFNYQSDRNLEQELDHAKAQWLDAQRAEKLMKVDLQQLEKRVSLTRRRGVGWGGGLCGDGPLPSCISSWFQSESKCEAFHMIIVLFTCK